MYSLGCVIYELAKGEPLFDGSTPVRLCLFLSSSFSFFPCPSAFCFPLGSSPSGLFFCRFSLLVPYLYCLVQVSLKKDAVQLEAVIRKNMGDIPVLNM
jgi:serine/threonine protein kinase